MTTCDPFDPLDDLLRQARWPEPEPLERSRLEKRWESLARERGRSRRQILRWILAASVVLAVGIGSIGWRLWNSREFKVLPPVPDVVPSQMAEEAETEPPRSAPPQPLVRPPTRYERLAFELIAERQKQLRVRRHPRLLIEALDKILSQPESDPAEVCRSLQPQRSAYEELILAHIGGWSREEQVAGLEILGEIGSPRAIPVLERLSRDPEFAKRAWPVALRLVPAALVARWARIGTPAQTNGAIAELLARPDDPEALDHFLRLIAHPGTRTPALLVIEAEAQPPIAGLFGFLLHGTKEQRHAAGLVLGRVASPEATEQLLTMARRQNFPPEVMIALLNSSDEKAAAFFDQAWQIPQVQTAVQMARLEWRLISYTATLSQPLEIYE